VTDAARFGAEAPIAGVDRGNPALACEREDAKSSLLFFVPMEPRSYGRAPLVGAIAQAYLGIIKARPLTQPAEPPVAEPIFNLPFIVIATVALLMLVHAFRAFVLTDDQDLQFLCTFAFIPARYGADSAFPGGFGADVWTFFTYAFIHADLMHLGLNLAWLIPFGTALARRLATWRYSVFMLVMAAIGAFAHLLTHFGEIEPMIGASAAISGAMAAAMRFVFQPNGPLARWRERSDEAYQVPAASLMATLRDPRFLLFLAVWLGLNALFGLGTISFGTEAGQEIAWQAHVGGFFAGLILFNLFDPIVPRGELDTEPSA
jgi:membrane associated rhomboid family serine protease